MPNYIILKTENLRNDQSGFSAVEALLIVLIISVVGFGSYYVWHSHKKAPVSNTSTHTSTQTSKTSSATTTPSPTSGPYAGWKTAALTYEKISYLYPSNWTVDDQSVSLPKSKNSCVYPGIDKIYLTSPSKEQVVLQTGIDCIGDGGVTSFGSVPVNSLGQSLYLDFVAYSQLSPSSPSFSCLAKNTDQQPSSYFDSKNVFSTGSTPANSFCYYPYMFYTDVGGDITSPPAQTVSSIENSADFNTAKLIFESLKY